MIPKKGQTFSGEKLMVELLYITLICPLGDVVCLLEAFEEKEGCANQLVDFPDVEQLTREQRSGKTLSIGHLWKILTLSLPLQPSNSCSPPPPCRGL